MVQPYFRSTASCSIQGDRRVIACKAVSKASAVWSDPDGGMPGTSARAVNARLAKCTGSMKGFEEMGEREMQIQRCSSHKALRRDA
ncbi:hypothetical protein ROS217_11586 [Roseovarius sp. 217]|nr:hypothetical protein ROS217_11586 [Roseovarius sp. 217]